MVEDNILKPDPTATWRVPEIQAACGAEILCGGGPAAFTGIAIDSRTIGANAFFVAICGEVHDGHEFVRQVTEAGTRGVLVQPGRIQAATQAELAARGVTCLAVADTTRALGDLAAYHRRRCRVPVVAITGSNGKTSTRKMAAGVVAEGFKTLATRGNLNNHIGLPLTLLKLRAAHQWAVVEMGMNRAGEIARLGEIAAPRVGVVTNIAPAHLEGLGSVDGVMRAKGELLEKIHPDGAAVLNGDDPRTLQLAREHRGKVVLFGESKPAEIRAESVALSRAHLRFTLALPSGTVPVRIQTPGRFMVSNALAAAAVGFVLDLSPEQIARGLGAFTPVSGRMALHRTGSGQHIIDDTYNANPASMAAAIDTLTALRGRNRGMAVLGSMAELGDTAPERHRAIGAHAAAAGLARLYVTGPLAGALAAGARKAGMRTEDIFQGSRGEIVEDLKTRVCPADWILIKGSRSMAMETVVAAMVDNNGTTGKTTGPA
jgi:UDP-N-acetylmuramoyl-tripeptide--D-alanyl-D-alanine ligase